MPAPKTCRRCGQDDPQQFLDFNPHGGKADPYCFDCRVLIDGGGAEEPNAKNVIYFGEGAMYQPYRFKRVPVPHCRRCSRITSRDPHAGWCTEELRARPVPPAEPLNTNPPGLATIYPLGTWRGKAKWRMATYH